MVVTTGYWPPTVPFDAKELMTVIEEYNYQQKEANRARVR